MTLRIDNLQQLGADCRKLNRNKFDAASARSTTSPQASSVARGTVKATTGRVEIEPATGPVSFSLPYPPAALSPNGSRGATWHKKAAAARRYRRDCGYAAKSALGPRVQAFAAPVIDLTFFCTTTRNRDRDNHIAMMKSAVDSLTDVGLWANDCRVQWGRVEFAKTAGTPAVYLTVREGEEALADCRRVWGLACKSGLTPS